MAEIKVKLEDAVLIKAQKEFKDFRKVNQFSSKDLVSLAEIESTEKRNKSIDNVVGGYAEKFKGNLKDIVDRNVDVVSRKAIADQFEILKNNGIKISKERANEIADNYSNISSSEKFLGKTREQRINIVGSRMENDVSQGIRKLKNLDDKSSQAKKILGVVEGTQRSFSRLTPNSAPVTFSPQRSANTILVSEIGRARRASVEYFAEEMGISFVKFSTKGDSKVCPKCNSIAGDIVVSSVDVPGVKDLRGIYAVGEVPHTHPFCRCIVSLVVTGKDALALNVGGTVDDILGRYDGNALTAEESVPYLESFTETRKKMDLLLDVPKEERMAKNKVFREMVDDSSMSPGDSADRMMTRNYQKGSYQFVQDLARKTGQEIPKELFNVLGPENSIKILLKNSKVSKPTDEMLKEINKNNAEKIEVSLKEIDKKMKSAKVLKNSASEALKKSTAASFKNAMAAEINAARVEAGQTLGYVEAQGRALKLIQKSDNNLVWKFKTQEAMKNFVDEHPNENYRFFGRKNTIYLDSKYSGDLVTKAVSDAALTKKLNGIRAGKENSKGFGYHAKGTVDSYIDDKGVKRKFRLNVQQETALRFMKEAKEVILNAAPGCLTGDSILNIRRGDKFSRCTDITIKDLYLKYNGLFKGRTWRKDFGLYSLSLKENYIGYHEVEDVIYSGVKEVFQVFLRSGRKLKATDIHPFKVNDYREGDKDGFRELKNLKVGDFVCVNGGFKSGKGRIVKNVRKEVSGLKYHPFAWKKKIKYKGKNLEYFRLHYSILVIEADYNKMGVEEYIDKLKNDYCASSKFIYVGNKVVHHKDGNPLNDSLENLEAVSKEEHNIIHLGISNKNLPKMECDLDEVLSISFVGLEETYDLIMKNPFRNYVANGIVVHNTGKTPMALSVIAELRAEGKIKKKVLYVTKNGLEGQGVKEHNKFIGDKKAGYGVSLEDRVKMYGDKNINMNFVSHSSFLEDVKAGRIKYSDYDAVITDEFQLMGDKTKSALTNFKGEYKFALSGTPVQDNASELWPIVKWMNPKAFKSKEEYVNLFSRVSQASTYFQDSVYREINSKLGNNLITMKQSTLKPYETHELKVNIKGDTEVKIKKLENAYDNSPYYKKNPMKKRDLRLQMQDVLDGPIPEKTKVLGDIMNSHPNQKRIIFVKNSGQVQGVKSALIDPKVKGVLEDSIFELTSETSRKNIDLIKEEFKNAKSNAVMIMDNNMSAGHDFPFAQVVVNYSPPSNYSSWEQRLARAWRNGNVKTDVYDLKTNTTEDTKRFKKIATSKKVYSAFSDAEGVDNTGLLSLIKESNKKGK